MIKRSKIAAAKARSQNRSPEQQRLSQGLSLPSRATQGTNPSVGRLKSDPTLLKQFLGEQRAKMPQSPVSPRIPTAVIPGVGLKMPTTGGAARRPDKMKQILSKKVASIRDRMIQDHMKKERMAANNMVKGAAGPAMLTGRANPKAILGLKKGGAVKKTAAKKGKK